MPTKIKFIISGFIFFSSFAVAKLNYLAVVKEKNYFIELGHEIDFSENNNYAVTTAVNVPWLLVSSSFRYTYFNNLLIPYHYFSTYHNLTYQKIRFYTSYNFNYVPRFKEITNRQLTNGFNFFWGYFLLSSEVQVSFLEKLTWGSRYSLAFFIKDDNHLGVNLEQKNKYLYTTAFININVNNSFIRLEYDFSSYVFTFTISFFHDFFRLKSELTNQPLIATKLANSLYFIPNNSTPLKR